MIIFRKLAVLMCLAGIPMVSAGGPLVQSGDVSLRHDIQRLADAGVIKGTITTWPMAWGPILADIEAADLSTATDDVLFALARVRQRARWETAVDEVHYNAKIGISDNGRRIRSFENTPRGRAETSVGLSWIGERLSIDLNAQFVDSGIDDQEFRADNSMIGVAVGNWSVAASTYERWWGPGWDGSLILSNNARPFPALVIDRLHTDPFESRWLSWLGPWDLSVMFGQLESDRVVPDAQFFGMRFNFRPLQSLEIGLTRTAQWCGEGRPCDLTTFGNLLIGKDNRGGEGIDLDNEPGNQLAGVDFRWAFSGFGESFAAYGQFIGEDEAGGFPSRWMGQLGVEWSGVIRNRCSARAFAEYAGTSCQFYESSVIFDCAYEHGIYRTGYRFRGNSIGHGFDNDAEVVSAGVSLADENDSRWRMLLRTGELNRGGGAPNRNTITQEPADLLSVDIAHSRAFWFGMLEAGVGYESIDRATSGTSSDFRLYVQWRTSY